MNSPYPLGNLGQVNATQNGNYYYFYDLEVEAADPASCTSERVPVALVVRGPNVAVEDIAATERIQLYPNPAEQTLNIQLDLEQDARVELIDLQGKKIQELQLAGEAQRSLAVDQWPRGLYFVRVFSGEAVYLGKVVLQ